MNKKISDDVVLDLGKNDTIIGIEIIDASKKISLNELLPLNYDVKKAS